MRPFCGNIVCSQCFPASYSTHKKICASFLFLLALGKNRLHTRKKQHINSRVVSTGCAREAFLSKGTPGAKKDANRRLQLHRKPNYCF